ncbi:FAD-binding oxidoreductase [Lysobacter psychrotolerans]|uniref:FAD-binding oxidoreductase n=1 Tax=Montanilutibacter psychrotolerans TaxID=1327343 RepID=A0A3M8SXU4_9GAMM|nr:FAD-binding oxidoreductase [Lysobacter psychrotolerans]
MGVGQAQSAVVIGAGIVGLTIALRLRQAGVRATLVDPAAVPASASYGNAGHIATEQVEPLASWATIRSAPRRLFAFGGALDVRDVVTFAPWMARFAHAASPAKFAAGRMALGGLLSRALPAWQALVDDIERPDLLHARGHTVLWQSPDVARRQRAAWMATDIGNTRVRDLAASELDAYDDLLSHRPAGGLRFSATGQVADVGEVMQALQASFVAAGGELLRARVATMAIERGRAIAVLEDGQRLGADIVLVAAGVASADLMAAFGPRPPLIAERGYHVQWPQHDWPSDMPPVVFEERSMIVTRFRGGLRAASFVEFARARTPADPRKWAALRRHVAALGLPVCGDGDTWMGARPTLPDYLPAIGRSQAASNLMYAFGHQHLGLTLAPVTSEIIAALVTGQEPPMSLAAFDLQRFHRNHGATHA